MDGATIFVYGTLKRGCRNHSLLNAADFLGEAWTEAGYSLVDCGSYPGLVKAPARVTGLSRAQGGHSVCGELYRVDTTLLAELDRLEDVPNEYERAAVRLSDGREAQAYFYRRDSAHLPRCGPQWKEC